MAQIQGSRTTLNTLSTHRKPDIDNKLIRVRPENTPLIVILKQLGKKVTTQPDFNHFEKALAANEVTVNAGGGYNSSATSIVLDDSSGIKPMDVIINPATMERMLVTANSVGTNTLTVTRSIGEAAAASIADDQVLFILGSAHEEGGAAALAISGDPVRKEGQVQIFKTAIKLTNTQKNTENYTGDDYDEEKREKAELHKLEIERAFWFGDGGYYDGSDGRARLTNGILNQITTNILDANGQLTESEFDDYLEDMFRYGSSTKTLFASARLLTIMNSWEKDRWEASSFGTKYGLPGVKEYINPHGNLTVVNAREIFRGSVFQYYSAILDLQFLKYRPLKNRDTAIETVENGGKDVLIEQFLTEAGLQFQNEQAHGLIRGASSR